MCCPLSERRLLSLPLCPGTLDGGLSACKSPRPAKPHITPEPHRPRLLNWTSDAAWKQRKLCSLRPITTTLYTISIFVINSCANCVLWCWEKYIYFTLLYFYFYSPAKYLKWNWVYLLSGKLNGVSNMHTIWPSIQIILQTRYDLQLKKLSKPSIKITL
jgi:hypothetical protein